MKKQQSSKANSHCLMVVISFIFFGLTTVYAADKIVAYKVRLELDSEVIHEGLVFKNSIYEKNGPKGFEVCAKEDEGAGIRLWYSKGTLEWRFVPKQQIKSIVTLKDINNKLLDANKKQWLIQKKKKLKQLSDNKARAAISALEKKKAAEKIAEETTKKEKSEANKETEEEKTEEEKNKEQAEALKDISPDKMTEEQLLLKFKGYTPSDHKRLMVKKNAVGGPGALSQEEKDFLKYYSKWEKAYNNAAEDNDEKK